MLGLCCCVRPPRVAAHSSSLLRLLLRSTGVVAGAHEFSCSAACGVFPGQGSNPPMVQQINKYGYAHSERSTAMKRVTDANRIKESQTGICGGRVCECACACTWLSIRYTCISRCMCRHLHICTHMCACTWLHVHIHTCAYVCTHVLFIWMHMHVLVCVHTHMCVHVWIDVCMHWVMYACLEMGMYV